MKRYGLAVELLRPEEISWGNGSCPDYAFVMCEHRSAIEGLRRWEEEGAMVINSARSVLNTYRENMVTLLSGTSVPFPRSVVVPTEPGGGGEAAWKELGADPVWVKRGDVHCVEPGDVVYASSSEAMAEALEAMAGRGITSAVVQRHIEGDLIKFYGVGAAEGIEWFHWFYHREQALKKYPFDVEELRSKAFEAARVLGLEIFGGDAIATEENEFFIIDVNAWPSFALFREEASERISRYLARRFLGR